MSQAGILNVLAAYPSIPTLFETDDGNAIPVANTLEILGTAVAAGSIPVETVGSGNSVTVNVQRSQAIAATDITKVGLAAFDSADFSVDANGFVTFTGGGGGFVTSVSGTLNRITSTGGATPVIDIDASYVGQTSITTLGTIATGTWEATDVGLAHGGTGASLADPNADRIMFWDDSAGTVDWLIAGTGLTITDKTITSSGLGGDVVGPASSTDNALVRWDLATGKLIQNSNATLTDAGSCTFNNTTAATSLTLRNFNQDTNAASESLIWASVAAGSSADPYFRCGIDATRSYAFGLDTSASNVFRIATDASAAATLANTSLFTISTVGAVTIPASTLSVTGGNFDVTRSAASANVIGTISNTENTSGTSNAYLNIRTNTASGGDPYTLYTVGGATNWITGIDNSVSDQFVIAAASSIGTSADTLQISTGGAVTIPAGNLSVTRSVAGDVSATIQNTGNNASATASLYLINTGASSSDPIVQYQVNGTTWTHGIDNSDSDAFAVAASNALGTTNVIRASTAGEINYPLQPAFLAYLTTTVNDVTGDGTEYTVIYDTEVFDQNSDFNLATSVFTAPVTGRCDIQVGASLIGGTSMTVILCRIVTSNRTYRITLSLNAGVTNAASCVGTVLADMDAGDTFTITLQATDSGGKIDDVAGTTGGQIRNWVSANLEC